MKDISFPPALWSTDADRLCQDDMDNCQQGVVTFDGQKGAELEVTFGMLVDTTIEMGGFHSDVGQKHVDALYGFSRNGRYIVLRDVTAYSPCFCVPGGTHQTFHAESMLVSRKPLWQAPVVRRLHIDIPGLREWLNLNPVKHLMKREDGKNDAFAYTYDSSDAQPVVLYDSGKVLIQIVRIVLDQPWNKDKGSFAIEHHCILEVIFRDNLFTLDNAVDEWVIPMWGFLCFCMGLRPSIKSIGFECFDGTWGNLYQRFTGRRNGLDFGRNDSMPLPYKCIENDVKEVVDRWLTLDGDAKRAASSLISLLDDWSMPLNLIFIACASSLEALSRVGVDVYRFSEEELERRIEMAVSSVPDEAVRDWVKSSLEHSRRRSAGSLEKKLLKRLKPFSEYIVPNSYRFLTEHRAWRNNYIHQNELTVEQQEMEPLWVHTWATWLLGYCAIGNLVGITPERIAKQLKETRFMGDRVQRSRERYAHT